jgi:hypothetical protein
MITGDNDLMVNITCYCYGTSNYSKDTMSLPAPQPSARGPKQCTPSHDISTGMSPPKVHPNEIYLDDLPNPVPRGSSRRCDLRIVWKAWAVLC